MVEILPPRFDDLTSDGPDADDGARLRAKYSHFFDHATGSIGRVVGSEKEPAGSHSFYIWASDEATTLDVGHIVITCSEQAVVIGVVDEPRRFSDLRSFLDDYFDRHLEVPDFEPPTQRPEILVFRVNVLATGHLRNDVTSHRPPIAGPVWFATKAAIEFALGTDDFSGVPIPALLHTNGNVRRDENGEPERHENGEVVFQTAPIWLDEEYLLGPEAGHANWTGQSGLATKTSHALFLTTAVFQKMHTAKKPKTVAALMFNVKGPDLLWLDKPADPPRGMEERYQAVGWGGLTEENRLSYSEFGLVPEPFRNLRIFAPFKPNQQPSADSTGVVRLSSGQYHHRLNTLRNAPGETHCVYPVLWELGALLRRPTKVFERGDLDDKLFGFIAELQERDIRTKVELDKLFTEIEAYFAMAGEDGKTPTEWRGHHQFTIRKARNRLNQLEKKFGGLVTDGQVEYGKLPPLDGKFSDGEVRVVDIAQCNTNVQEVLVSTLIDKVWRLAEQGPEQLGVDKIVVFVDELNKYAPNGGEGGLRDILVDIAARGRHLNVVLFGAQQFRSKVETEILGNCGTSFYGRIGDEEIINASYRSLSDTARAELLGLPKGRLLVRHAHFRTPLFGTFPRQPSIPGNIGQRVFNDEAAVGGGDTHGGDGLYFLLKRLMGDNAPAKGLVRDATEGFPSDILDRVCSDVTRQWDGYKGTSAEGRFTPWKIAQNVLERQAHLRQRS